MQSGDGGYYVKHDNSSMPLFSFIFNQVTWA